MTESGNLRETFVLGAGLSRAVHGPMPTLGALGDSIRKALLSDDYSSTLPEALRRHLSAGQIPFGNVELWLSTLAERQPFMSRADALRNQALFEEITRLLIQLVSEAQKDFWQSSPDWMHRMLRLWHLRRPTVITFNYDTIVEEATQQLDAPGSDGDIVASILAQLPRRAVPLQLAETLPPSFQLLKLHGSLDWYWNPDDPSGESLCRLAQDVTADQARAAVAGKTPFIVPPLATKASFYSLGLLRQLWQDAALALASADRVVVIGYSVPLTDLATAALLTLAANDGAEWHVVNPDARNVVARLVELGVRPDRITNHNSAAEWADWYEAEHCNRMNEVLLRQLEGYRTKDSAFAPIMVRRTRSDYQVVRRMAAHDNEVILVAAPLKQGEVLGAEFPREPQLVELLASMDSPRRVRASVEGVDGLHDALGALDPRSVRGSSGSLSWCPIEIQDTQS